MSARRRFVRCEDGIDETRELRVEVITAQRVESRRSLEALPDDTGLTQDPKVVRTRRLDDRELETAAGPLVSSSERGHDAQPDRIGQRVEDGGQRDLITTGMDQRFSRGRRFWGSRSNSGT